MNKGYRAWKKITGVLLALILIMGDPVLTSLAADDTRVWTGTETVSEPLQEADAADLTAENIAASEAESLEAPEAESAAASEAESLAASEAESTAASEAESAAAAEAESIASSEAESAAAAEAESSAASEAESAASSEAESNAASEAASMAAAEAESIASPEAGSVAAAEAESIASSEAGSMAAAEAESIASSEKESVVSAEAESVAAAAAESSAGSNENDDTQAGETGEAVPASGAETAIGPETMTASAAETDTGSESHTDREPEDETDPEPVPGTGSGTDAEAVSEAEDAGESVFDPEEDTEECTEENAETEAETETEEDAAFLQEVCVDGIRIRVRAEAGVFPAGSTLKAEKVEDEQTLETVGELTDEAASCDGSSTAYDLAGGAAYTDGSADKVHAAAGYESGSDGTNSGEPVSFTFDIEVLDPDGQAIQPDTDAGEVVVAFDREDVLGRYEEETGEEMTAAGTVETASAPVRASALMSMAGDHSDLKSLSSDEGEGLRILSVDLAVDEDAVPEPETVTQVSIYHIDDDLQQATGLEVTEAEGMYEAPAEHFSLYTIEVDQVDLTIHYSVFCTLPDALVDRQFNGATRYKNYTVTYERDDGTAHTQTIEAYCIQPILANPLSGTDIDISMLGSADGKYSHVVYGLFYLSSGPAWGCDIPGTDGNTYNIKSLYDAYNVAGGYQTYALTHMILSYAYMQDTGTYSESEFNVGLDSNYEYPYLNDAGMALVEQVYRILTLLPRPYLDMSFTPESRESAADDATDNGDGTQTSRTFTYKTMYSNSISFTVPEEWTCTVVNDTFDRTVTYQGGETATVYGESSFSFTAPDMYSGTETFEVDPLLYGASRGLIYYSEGKQDLAGLLYTMQNGFSFKVSFEAARGKLTLVKSAADSSLAALDTYSLAGAVYTVYTDKDCTDRAGMLKTAADGSSGTLELDRGTYYVKETAAPAGYRKDTKRYTAEVLSNETCVLKVEDEPVSAAGSLKKTTAYATGRPLAGARFTVSYYDNYKASGTAKATWVFESDEDGTVTFGEDHLVSGSMAYGDGVLPLGSLTIQETKAPAGYAVNSKVITVTIRQSGDTAVTSPDLAAGKLTVEDTPLFGGLKIAKLDSESDGEPQGGASLQGAVFSVVVNDSDGLCRKDDPKTTYRKGDEIATLTSGSDGIASLSAILQSGSYTVCEKTAPAGYRLSSKKVSFTIASDGQTVDLTGEGIADEVIRGGVKIRKYDLGWSRSAPQGDASLQGAEFTIYNRSAHPVMVGGVSYAKDAAVMTLTTDADGLAQTTAKALPYGSYEIRETKAPSGYRLEENASRTFTVTADGAVSDLTSSNAGIGDPVIRGGVRVQKRDYETGEDAPQGEATFGGTVFAVINESTHAVRVNGKDYAPSQTVLELTADENGLAQTDADTLPYGSYRIIETSAPEGYLQEGRLEQSFTIRENGTYYNATTEETAISNQVIRGGVQAQKRDYETGEDTPQGEAAFGGTVFAVINESTHAVRVNGKDYEPLQTVLEMTADETGLARTDADALPYGNYRIVEVTAPEGYLQEGRLEQTFTIRENGVCYDATTEETAISNQVIRGGVKVRKRDYETGEATPVGGATFEGTVFAIINESTHAVRVGGIDYEPAQTVLELTADETGLAQTDADALPYGSYRIVEVSAPDGYLHEGKLGQTFTIRENGVYYDATTEDTSISNQVVRGDISLRKIDSETQKTMAGISFRITSNTTGESHVITTDANGEYHSASSWVPHSTRTNEGGAEDGLWFGLTSDGSSGPLDELGALPFDEYTIEELACEANRGKQLYRDVFTIYRNQVEVNLNNIENRDGPSIATAAEDAATGTHLAMASEDAVIIDTVVYEGLTRGKTYTLKGYLADKESGELIVIDEETVSAQKTFTATLTAGSVYLTFQLDAGSLAGRSAVAFEYLYDEDGELIAGHADPEDEDQTVRFPSIATRASESESGAAMICAGQEVTVIDTVVYENLQAGLTYRLSGELVDSQTGQTVRDANGKEVTAVRTFLASESSGKVEMTFTFTVAETDAGTDMVACERLKISGQLIAEHADLTDEDQTVHVPSVRTVARDEATQTHQIETGTIVTIVDTVIYQGLTAGQNYEVTGRLVVKSTGKTAVDDSGNELTAGTAFTPEASDGRTEVRFTFTVPASLASESLVAYEQLYYLTGAGEGTSCRTDSGDTDETSSQTGSGDTGETGSRTDGGDTDETGTQTGSQGTDAGRGESSRPQRYMVAGHADLNDADQTVFVKAVKGEQETGQETETETENETTPPQTESEDEPGTEPAAPQNGSETDAPQTESSAPESESAGETGTPAPEAKTEPETPGETQRETASEKQSETAGGEPGRKGTPTGGSSGSGGSGRTVTGSSAVRSPAASVRTGDNTPLQLYLLILAMAGMMCLWLIRMRRRWKRF